MLLYFRVERGHEVALTHHPALLPVESSSVPPQVGRTPLPQCCPACFPGPDSNLGCLSTLKHPPKARALPEKPIRTAGSHPSLTYTVSSLTRLIATPSSGLNPDVPSFQCSPTPLLPPPHPRPCSHNPPCHRGQQFATPCFWRAVLIGL